MIIVIIAAWATPFAFVWKFALPFRRIVEAGIYRALTDPASPNYDRLWKPIFLTELGVSMALFLVGLWALYLMHMKKWVFIPVFSAIAVFWVIFILFDSYAISLALPNVPVLRNETMVELVKAGFVLLVICPYLLTSARSHRTFTR